MGDKKKHGHGATTDRYEMQLVSSAAKTLGTNTNTTVHLVMKHAIEYNRTVTVQEYCSTNEIDDCTCTSTTDFLKRFPPPSRQAGTARGWRATGYQITDNVVLRHLTSVRKTHSTHKDI